jgi:hypothetical protein
MRRLLTPLWAVRIFGPISTAGLSLRLRRDRHSINVSTDALVNQGLVVRDEEGWWDVTAQGRREAPAAVLTEAPEPVRAAAAAMTWRLWGARR